MECESSYLLPSYKSFDQKRIGKSSIATLVMVGRDALGVVTAPLTFGGNGEYSAYVVDKPATIGEHYTMVAEFWGFLRIYDDTSLVASFSGTYVRVYRAGYYGCIIEIIDRAKLREEEYQRKLLGKNIRQTPKNTKSRNKNDKIHTASSS